MQSLPNKLTLAYILRDEAEKIEESIKSFHLDDGTPLYSYLVIAIDNATKDNTYEIIKKYTDNIEFFNWEENFAKHRNDVIDRCEKLDAEWIFFPDGHEILRHGDEKNHDSRIDILHILNGEVDADINMLAPTVEIDVDEWDIPDIVFNRPMIFRKGKARFHRAVHNYLLQTEGQNALVSGIRLIHNMPPNHAEIRSQMRKDMNVRKLRNSVSKNLAQVKNNQAKKDHRDEFYLATTLDEASQIEDALKLYKSTLKNNHLKDRDIASQAAIFIANAYIKRKKNYALVKHYCYKAIENRWDRAESYYFLGRVAKEESDYDAAIHWSTIATKMSLPNTRFFLIAKHYSSAPWETIMIAKNAIGDLDGALEAAKKVLSFKPTHQKCIENVNNLQKAIEARDKDIKAKQLLQIINPKINYNMLAKQIKDPFVFENEGVRV